MAFGRINSVIWHLVDTVTRWPDIKPETFHPAVALHTWAFTHCSKLCDTSRASRDSFTKRPLLLTRRRFWTLWRPPRQLCISPAAEGGWRCTGWCWPHRDLPWLSAVPDTALISVTHTSRCGVSHWIGTGVTPKQGSYVSWAPFRLYEMERGFCSFICGVVFCKCLRKYKPRQLNSNLILF